MANVTLNLSEALKRAYAAYLAENLPEAEKFCQAIISAKGDEIDALHMQAVIQSRLGRKTEALTYFTRVLELQPNNAEALNNQGSTLTELNRYQEALSSYDRALALRPNYTEAIMNRGNVLLKAKRFDEALANYESVLALQPDHAEAHFHRGNTLNELKCFNEALACYDRALSIRPNYHQACHNRGRSLFELRLYNEALASYEQALAIRSEYPEALNNRGNALFEMKRMPEALASYEQALALRPDYLEALHNRGNTLRELKRFKEALESYQRALDLVPDFHLAAAAHADLALRVCDWPLVAQIAAKLPSYVANGPMIYPFELLGYTDSAALHLTCNKTYISKNFEPWPHDPLWRGQRWRNKKVKVAYLSSDFRIHPVASLAAELFELHDRSNFEVLGVSFGADDRSEIRKRLAKAFDQFLDVQSRSDRDIAETMNRLDIDIAVDLNGHTRYCRPAIFAHRPAPIQVNYLGFTGTIGAKFIDYIIADEVVLPFDQQPFYTEKIVHLPNCFLVSDTRKTISPSVPTRSQLGLPENGFIFCCFNNSYKINSMMFDIWMRLLTKIEGSVLWLSDQSDIAVANLRQEAAARSVDPGRLIFAPKIPLHEDHLARHARAELFLDTLPYNAHTTTNDALWAGLPVMTCTGKSFAARVAASQLHAIGLSELVTSSLEDYEALALKLATNPEILCSHRSKLKNNRLKTPLFDTERFRQNIEAAYMTMWEIWQRGESPKCFTVNTASK